MLGTLWILRTTMLEMLSDGNIQNNERNIVIELRKRTKKLFLQRDQKRYQPQPCRKTE